jgi:amino acid transporter
MKRPYLYILSIIVLFISGILTIHNAYEFFFTNEGIKFYGGWPWGFIVGASVFLLTFAYVGLITYVSYKALKDKSKFPELKDRPNR